MKIINWLHTDIYYAVIGGEAVETKPANMKGVDWKTKEIYKLKKDWWCSDLLEEAFSSRAVEFTKTGSEGVDNIIEFAISELGKDTLILYDAKALEKTPFEIGRRKPRPWILPYGGLGAQYLMLVSREHIEVQS